MSENPEKIYKCEKCGKLVTKKFGSGRFCSRTCANSKKHSELTKRKISESVKKNEKCFGSESYKIKAKQEYINRIKEYANKPNHCCICNKDLSYFNRNHKTCGDRMCLKKVHARNGGYKKKGGKGKSGYYKGIYCASTYELVYLIYCLDHNIQIKRCENPIVYNDHKYYPDFEIDNKIIEIKGYKSDNYYKQLFIANKNNIHLEVKFREDLDKEFNWVKNNYKYKDLSELYDDPIYFEYKCSFCGSVFKTSKERKGINKFCSRSCIGKFIGNDLW